MKYIIVEADSAGELQNEVRDWIELGYKPQGSVAVSHINIDPGFFGNNEIETKYTQAMVKDGK